MNTEAIIEELLLSRNEAILNTPLDELHLSNRVHRGLWRARVRTVGDVAHAWSRILTIRNFGKAARQDTLDALQAWFLSIPEIPAPDPAEIKAEGQAEGLTAVPDQNSIPNIEEHAEGQAEGLTDADTEPPDGEPDSQLPIEVLHLSQRTYRALKRNHIETIADIRRELSRIRSFRNVGPRALDEIRKALEDFTGLEVSQ